MSPGDLPIPFRKRVAMLATGLVVFALIMLITTEFSISALVWTGVVELKPLRGAFEVSSTHHHKFDEQTGWSLKPGFVSELISVNAQGIRSSKPTLNAAALGDKKRLMLIGDSMLFGVYVRQEAIFSELLQHRQPEIDTVNSGVIGYCTGQELIVLRRSLDWLRPDHVILFFTQQNDILWNPRTDYYNAGFSLDRAGELVAHPPRDVHRPPWYQRLNSYRLLDTRFLSGRDLTYLRHRLDLALRGGDSTSWRITEALLGEIAQLLEVEGIGLTIIDIPTNRQRSQPNASLQRQILLRSFATRMGIDYIDLLDRYPSDSVSLFIPGDSHWNEEGHEFMAGVVEGVLRAHNLLP